MNFLFIKKRNEFCANNNFLFLSNINISGIFGDGLGESGLGKLIKEHW